MGDFEDSWQEFVSGGRLEYGGHTDPDFRDGHSLSASFIIPAGTPEVLTNLSPLRDALRPFSFVALHPNPFLHISVAFAGFVCESRAGEGIVSAERLHEISRAAAEILATESPFDVNLANLNAFPSVAYVEVHDEEGGIGRIADKLSEACGIEAKPDDPHLTIAYFRAPDDTGIPDELVRAMQRYREHPVGRVRVDGVRLTLLNLEEEYPHLEVVEEFRFG